MNRIVVTMILSGMCFLPSGLPRLYILVPNSQSWTDAQNFCRSKYTDLATVQNMQELAALNTLIGSFYYVWIGLNTDSEAWRWSSENQDYYSVGEADFRMWYPGKPSGGGYYKVCVTMCSNGEWTDQLCSNTFPFICYNGTAGTQDPSSSFILVNQFMTWMAAQSYCRLYHTDLASVRTQAENSQIKMMLQNEYTWIGLYRNSWKWSDGSPLSVSNWYPRAPTSTISNTCVVSYYGKWTNIDCTTKCYSACFLAQTWKQVVRMELKKSDSSVDMEDLKADILQKIYQNVKDQILSEEVKLRWVKWPDGKIFHKKNTDKIEEIVYPLK